MRKILAVYTCLAVCLLTLTAGVLSLSGCASFDKTLESVDKNQVLVKLSVEYAVFKYAEHFPVEERAAHMANVGNVVSNIRAVVNSDEQTNLQLLDSALIEQLNKLHLSPSDLFLARNLAELIEQELQQRIGRGSLDEKSRVIVVNVLDWISEAADIAA